MTNSPTQKGAPSGDNSIQPAPIEGLRDSKVSAAVLGISTRALWTLTKQGRIPCVRIGRAVRYDPADLRRFIDASKSEVRA